MTIQYTKSIINIINSKKLVGKMFFQREMIQDLICINEEGKCFKILTWTIR